MNCPIDDTTLQITAREGVEIDYCPKCRGVWLDRGELDKLIERALQHNSRPQDYSYDRKEDTPHNYRDNEERGEQKSHDDSYDSQKKRKKGSFLGEMFDF